MHALFLNATLKRSPEPSSTGALAEYVAGRLADHVIEPGVVSEPVRDGDEWPALHGRVLAADIVVFATPTWLGQPSSIVKRALERMDALLSETSGDGTPVAYNKVAGFIVVGNEDGAHHCISEMAGAAIDIGFTVPGQAWTYWNKGPGPGEEEYINTSERDWTHSTGDAMAHVLAHTAKALAARPIPKPPNS